MHAALRPPRAHGAPLPAVEWRATPEDFCVDEILSFEPTRSGPHWLLRVEKRGANTRWVAGTVENGYLRRNIYPAGGNASPAELRQ